LSLSLHDQDIKAPNPNREQTLRQIALLRHRRLELAKQEQFKESAEFAQRAGELASRQDAAA